MELLARSNPALVFMYRSFILHGEVDSVHHAGLTTEALRATAISNAALYGMERVPGAGRAGIPS